MFVLNWFIHILLMILVLEFFKILLGIEDRVFLVLFIPVTLIITGVMKKFVVSLIINNTANTAVFLFTLSILLQTIVGMGLFMVYNLCIYERIVYKDETN